MAIAIAAGFLAWLLFVRDDDGGNGGSGGTNARAASVQDLQALANSVGHPIYWAGRRRGGTYELTNTRDGRVYVRYLPAGVQIGDPKPGYLTVGTYPYPNARRAVRSIARRQGAISDSLPGGGLAATRPDIPHSVYMAFPADRNLLVEVFAPSPARARRLATSERIAPVP